MQDIMRPHADALQNRGARFRLECGEHHLPARLAVPIALIVNELVTNAIRHGVGEREDAFVQVTVRPSESGLLIEVQNNGERFPDESRLPTPGSIGWDLVGALAAQVGASITLEREPHTIVTIAVPDVLDPSSDESS